MGGGEGEGALIRRGCLFERRGGGERENSKIYGNPPVSSSNTVMGYTSIFP